MAKSNWQGKSSDEYEHAAYIHRMTLISMTNKQLTSSKEQLASKSSDEYEHAAYIHRMTYGEQSSN